MPARGKPLDSDPRPAISDRPAGMGVCGAAPPAGLKAPFPYFGGKRRVAELVWERLGDCDNVIEPFCGSAAFLLARPHPPRIETVNDADCMVANFWRATQRDPEGVAGHADGPVNEADLHARHRWLVLSPEAAEFRRRMRTDPDYFDPRVAGWWCWGLCCWIGGGWCTPHGETADGDREDRRPQLGQHGKGATKKGEKPEEWNQMPFLGGGDHHTGKGVHAKGQVPNLSGDAGAAGRGVVASAGHKKRVPATGERPAEWKQMPLLTNNGQGQGVHRDHVADTRPQLADAYDVGRGVNANGELGTCAARRAWLVEWFGRLRDRLRLVRVCCGDWLRVCDSDSVTTRLGRVGLFFDPPYALSVARMHAWVRHLRGEGPEPKKPGRSTNRDGNLYATDGADVDRLVAGVHLYCLERGPDPRYRIALAGYAGEHDALEAAGWTAVAWKAHGGYGNRSAKGKANAARERIWFSPHCLKPGQADGLFAGMEG